MKRLLRLYPPAWRTRYEAEVGDLLAEVPSSPHAAFDLIRGAFGEWVHLAARLPLVLSQPVGGPPMRANRLQRHPTSLALLALLLVAPSLLFVAFSLLAYQVGVPGLAARMEPIVKTVTALGWVGPFLLLAPFLGLLMAALPMVRMGSSRCDGEMSVTLAFRGRALNAGVVVLCALLGGVLVSYLISEFLLEGRPPLG